MKNKLLLTFLFLSSCGPVATKIYISPAMQQAESAQQSMKKVREQSVFSYQEKTQDCRNSLGLQGYNQNRLGACSLILDISQIELIQKLSKSESRDLRGSLFLGLNLVDNTSFENLNLEGSIWSNVKGKGVKFNHCNITHSQFIQSKLN